MRAHATPARLATAVLTLLHLAVVGVVPLADGRLEAATLNAAVHVESEPGAPCAPAHDDLFCQLCRVVHDVGGLRIGTAGDLSPASALRAPIVSVHAPPCGPAWTGAHGSRAPPRR